MRLLALGLLLVASSASAQGLIPRSDLGRSPYIPFVDRCMSEGLDQAAFAGQDAASDAVRWKIGALCQCAFEQAPQVTPATPIAQLQSQAQACYRQYQANPAAFEARYGIRLQQQLDARLTPGM